jgi:hypothetical protein
MQITLNIPDNLPPLIISQYLQAFDEKRTLPLMVNVSVCDGIWTAECDALGLVTEADSYEALTERALAIAPELAELNQVGIEPAALRLRFSYEPLSNGVC